jgi:MoaA/NifB/PqqE/SkfB family radical SAM enzyme
VSIVLTNACNLNCVTCWSYSPYAGPPPVAWQRQHLPTDRLNEVYAELAELGTERVIYTGGGDPLAYPDFHTTAKAARSAGLKRTLISNLSLVREPERFLDTGIETILANFSAATPETYLAFHPNRKPTDFDTLLALLRQLGAQPGTTLKLVFVVCGLNCHEAGTVVELAGELGAGVQFKLMSTLPGTGHLALSEPQRKTLLTELPSIQARALALGVPTNLTALHSALHGQTTRELPIETVGCSAGWFYGRIAANGTVRYCCSTHPDLVLGNILTQNFRELWFGERWQALRARLRRGQFLDGCEACGKWDLNLQVRQALDDLTATTDTPC